MTESASTLAFSTLPGELEAQTLAHLETPRLVVFEEAVRANIDAMQRALGAVAPGHGLDLLRPHVKTHKSARILRLLLDAGVQSVKCTPNELELAVECGVHDIFVAYPLLDHAAARVAEIARRHPRSIVRVQAGLPGHVKILREAAARHDVRLPCFLDLDVGNARTGAPLARIDDLLSAFDPSPDSGVPVCGIHAYDGHNSSPDASVRAEIARGAMADVARAVERVRKRGFVCERVVVAGTPAFREDLEEILRLDLGVKVEVSPGTFVFHDSKYEGVMPGLFRFAALVLSRVMDLPRDDRVTLDLGHKRWGIDQGPIEVLGVPGLEFVSASEEHTVLRRGPDAPELGLGAPVWIVPRHVCPTVNLFEWYTFVRSDGSIEERVPVDARNR